MQCVLQLVLATRSFSALAEWRQLTPFTHKLSFLCQSNLPIIVLLWMNLKVLFLNQVVYYKGVHSQWKVIAILFQIQHWVVLWLPFKLVHNKRYLEKGAHIFLLKALLTFQNIYQNIYIYFIILVWKLTHLNTNKRKYKINK